MSTTNVKIYTKTAMDLKMHKLAASEFTTNTDSIDVSDNATGYPLYHVQFEENTLDKIFDFTFAPCVPTTYVTAYYDGAHAIHISAPGGNKYRIKVYDIAAGQDLATISVSGLMGCRITSI